MSRYELTSGYVSELGLSWRGLTEWEAQKLIAQAAEYQKVSTQYIVDELEAAIRPVYTGKQSPNFYYDHGMEMIRICPNIRNPIARDRELVKCSCGHTVPKNQVMSASLGSSCPNCYDRMSD